ncbi:hypothetical protein UP10_12345 [Bradyrhizobium sp. LTSPM299]|nr:hypothetical protein UP10_12345 [Bradyrhizobium sp. LTSPM299]
MLSRVRYTLPVILRGCEALPSSVTVIARLDRATQYAADPRFYHWCLWNTGSPACAGDDTEQGEQTNSDILRDALRAPQDDGSGSEIIAAWT